MSGSGATCFGIFDSAEDARVAAATIADAHPDWWVRAVKTGG
jgi:4-diphosphocytidyl-2-C-methyl-D-erythritol kinase